MIFCVSRLTWYLCNWNPATMTDTIAEPANMTNKAPNPCTGMHMPYTTSSRILPWKMVTASLSVLVSGVNAKSDCEMTSYRPLTPTSALPASDTFTERRRLRLCVVSPPPVAVPFDGGAAVVVVVFSSLSSTTAATDACAGSSKLRGPCGKPSLFSVSCKVQIRSCNTSVILIYFIIFVLHLIYFHILYSIVSRGFPLNGFHMYH